MRRSDSLARAVRCGVREYLSRRSEDCVPYKLGAMDTLQLGGIVYQLTFSRTAASFEASSSVDCPIHFFSQVIERKNPAT